MQIDSEALYEMLEYLEDLRALRARLERYCRNCETRWKGRPLPERMQKLVDTAIVMIGEINGHVRARERSHSAAVLQGGRLD